MSEIWKFQIPALSDIEIEMPEAAEILHFGLDPSGDPCVWALVVAGRKKRNRLLRLLGTGHQFNDTPGKYIGTVTRPPYVWHLFDQGWGTLV